MNPSSRARLSEQLDQAIAAVPRTWSLDRFVAWNPLADLEDLAVEDATLRAVARHGAAVPGDERAHRRRARSGHIGDAVLLGAIERVHPSLVAEPPVELAGTEVPVAEVLRLDLVLGPMAADPLELRLAVEHCDVVEGGCLGSLVDEISGDWAAGRLGLLGWRPAEDPDGAIGTFLRTAQADPRVRRAARGGHGILADLPVEPLDLIERALVLLHVDPAARGRYLERHLARQPGWASQLAHAARTSGGDEAAALAEHLAVRLALEVAFVNSGDRRRHLRRARSDAAPMSWPTASARAAAVLDAATLGGAEVAASVRRRVEELLDRVGPADRLRVWEEAAAEVARLEAVAGLPPVTPASSTVRPDLQLVCCIDPRSERLRRHVEAAGGERVETFGFAGFFGLAVELEAWDSAPTASCPVIVDPTARVREVASDDRSARRAQRRADARRARSAAWAGVKGGPLAAVGVPEVLGLPAGLAAVVSTSAPHALARWRRTADAARRPTSVQLTLESERHPDAGWDHDTRVAVAAGILRGMGLVDRFARLVVLCGHTSDHRNNPHRAALTCGACGGRGGGMNARVAAALLNRPDVRAGLAGQGIAVPDDTWFAAAEHETTTDRVDWLDDSAPGHAGTVLTWARDLIDAAGRATATERAAALPSALGARTGSSGVASSIARRGVDWSEAVPEWGLAGNRALVIGPRELTADVDLRGTAFLHSYRSELDPDGAVLAGILAGPLLVAHGISAQYLASAAAPEGWSAGPKSLANPVGSAGVREGAEGDLRIGLPAESLGLAGDLRHDPARLVVVIDAPAEHVAAVLDRVPAARRLLDGGWLHLCARSGSGAGWVARERDGAWSPVNGVPVAVPAVRPAVSVP